MTPIPHQAKYNRDPKALEWARANVQRYIDQYAKFEAETKAKKDKAIRDREDPEVCRSLARTESGWRKMKNMLKMNFIGGEGCIFGAFDERWPNIADSILEDYLHD